MDEFTREALAIEVRRRIDSDQTVAVLERLVADRGTAPGFVRCDNGPEMTAHALRDWCRFTRAGSAYIEPGSPWQNAYVESFGGRVRDELLSVELFSCLAEAQDLIEDWRVDYNEHRPHSALHMMAPAAFAASLRHPLPEPTATAAGERIEWRGQLIRPASHPQSVAFQPGQRQNLAEDITPTPSHADSLGADHHTPTTPQLSQQVDR